MGVFPFEMRLSLNCKGVDIVTTGESAVFYSGRGVIARILALRENTIHVGRCTTSSGAKLNACFIE